MKPEPSLLDLIHRTSQILEDRFARTLRGEVTPRQLAILRAAHAMPGMSQTGLVDTTGVDRSTASEIIKRLVKRGLLKRRRSRSDARAYIVDLTPDGRRVLDEADPVLMAVEVELLDAVPQPQREVLIATLETMVRARCAADPTYSLTSLRPTPSE